ncbi:sensor histidine kinase [Sphaerisporangium aureirubrum]|uniref:Oxygen sensor histidine kinase NreB n=1 Tax=Sphaerisporangium aureirubrum TaxID=1544736 RepID=A0ABW1ND10_9ACTN
MVTEAEPVPGPVVGRAPESGPPVPWVAPVLYAAVLAGGVYYELLGVDGPRAGRLAGFVGGLVALFAVDVWERRRYPTRTPAGVAVGLLCVRLALFVVVTAFDTAGVSRVLFVLVPFTAYFAFGRVAGVSLGAVSAVLLAAWFTVSAPGWWLDPAYLSDLLMFGLGLILALSMAAVAVSARQARARLEESHVRLTAYAGRVAELTTAMERHRLAREIHDSLGHHLTAIGIQLEKTSAFLDRDRAAAEQALADARWSAAQALAEVRQSVRALRAEGEPFSLSTALTDLVRHMDSSPSVTVRITGEESRYDPASLTALYRAAQESLTNARRHAAATHVTVSLSCGESEARLTVADDGRGLPASPPDGYGLRGMRERVRPLGGTVTLTGPPGTGTTVTVTIPRPGAPTDPPPRGEVMTGPRGAPRPEARR